MDRIHDLDDGQTTLRINRLVPEPFERLAQIGSLDRLIVRQEHRNEAGVGGALHVVLTAQGMQTRTRTADLAGNQRKRDQTARIIGAVNMLANTHAPEDDRGFGRRVEPRHFAQGLGVDAADRSHLLRGEVDDTRLQFLEPFGVACDILLVG